MEVVMYSYVVIWKHPGTGVLLSVDHTMSLSLEGVLEGLVHENVNPETIEIKLGAVVKNSEV